MGMGSLVKLAGVFAVIAILLGVVIVNRYPVKHDVEGKWHIIGYHALGEMLNVMAFIGTSLNLGDHMSLMLYLNERSMRLYSLFGDADIDEWWDKFDDVPVMVYEPKNREKNGPVIMYIHGGGWMFGSPRSYRHVTQTMAKQTGLMVISVDYELAPKSKYPGPFNECMKVFQHLIKHADKYKIDKSKIILAGDSAGGQLSAAISYTMKDKPIKPLAQVLIYPALQFIDFNLPSYQIDSPPSLGRTDVVWMCQNHAFGDTDFVRIQAALEGRHISAKHKDKVRKYLDHSKLTNGKFSVDDKKQPGTVKESEYKELERITMEPTFSPLMAPSFKGLPITLMLTMEFDVLRDDGYLYAARCRDEGVQIQHINYKKGWHPSMLFRTKLPFQKDIANFVKNVVAGKPVN